MPWDSFAGCLEPAGDTGQQVATLKCLPAVFSNLLTAALTLAGITAIIFLILGGIKLIGSGGDPKQVAGAKKTITFTLIGLVIILLSFFIIQVIAHLTGATCITTFGLGSCSSTP